VCLFWDKVLLCSSGWSPTYETPSASWVLGLQTWATIPDYVSTFSLKKIPMLAHSPWYHVLKAPQNNFFFKHRKGCRILRMLMYLHLKKYITSTAQKYFPYPFWFVSLSLVGNSEVITQINLYILVCLNSSLKNTWWCFTCFMFYRNASQCEQTRLILCTSKNMNMSSLNILLGLFIFLCLGLVTVPWLCRRHP
jgi:hypothetical protein